MAHTMNLTFKDILTGDDFAVLEDLQVKINNSILALFNRSPVAKAQAEIAKAVRGYSSTRFNSWMNSIFCINQLKSKINHFFEHVFVPRRAVQAAAYDFQRQVEIPAKFDLDEEDYSIIFILLQYKNSFDKAICRFSEGNSRIKDIIPIYHCLQTEVETTSTRLIASFGLNTEDGRNIGDRRTNEPFIALIKDCIDNRYNGIKKNPLIIGAYLICGDRMWESKQVPKITANMTSKFYTYLNDIKVVGTGIDASKSLFNEVLDYLVRMVNTLRMYNVGTEKRLEDATIRRELESWINLSLPLYIKTSLVALDRKYTKTVDWKRLAIENATVSNLGC